MAFKMKGFPMQKGTGSYLKEVSAAQMKKEAAARMKKASMAAQRAEGGGGSKPDFLDLDGDGNKTESMKSAAASPTKQTAREAKKATKKARKFARKANKLADKANKYIKKKGKDASMVVDETGETVERYELNPRQAKRATKKMNKAKKAFSKAKGVEAEFKAKYSPATQKYDKSDTDERVYDLDQKKYDKFRSTQGKKFPDIRYLGKKENKKFLEEYLKRKDNKIVSKSISRSATPQKSEDIQAVKDHKSRVAEIISSYHGKGIDTTGYAKTGKYKYFETKEGKKAVKNISKAIKNSAKQAVKDAKAEGVNLTIDKK